MAKYTGTILTNKGKELLVRAILGEAIVFTKVEIGKGILSPGTDKESLTSLIDSFKIVSITSTTKLANGGYRIRISFNNKGFVDDTYLREVGLFARGEDGTEILYSYCNTDTPNLIPNESSGVIESVEDIITYISSAATINAVIDESHVYATIKDLVEGLATKEDKFTKNGAFNKPFGIISGTVMEGNKRAVDLGGEAAFNKKDAFNRSFSHVISSTSKILVASAYAVKIAYDKGANALTKATSAQSSANSAQTKANQAYTLADGKESKFSKKSAFNKNFGTGNNDISKGNHSHSIESLIGCPHGIGDYWITESTTNPATKWTGTIWTKLERRILLGTSSGYGLGTQGGTTTVTLVKANLPNIKLSTDSHIHTKAAHEHDLLLGTHQSSSAAGLRNSGGHGGIGGTASSSTYGTYSNRDSKNRQVLKSAGGGNTGAAAPKTEALGSGSAFNIMNPYRAVNIWRRTA